MTSQRPTQPTKDAPLDILGAELVVRVEGREVGRLTLGEAPVTVGSDPACELVVDYPTVSRRHVEVSLEPGGVRVRDLGSTNGTRYLGAKVSEVRVPLGSALLLGGAELRVQSPEPAREISWQGLTSRAPKMVRALERLARAAASDATLLLEGETGTGKEVAARAVHRASPRAAATLEVVDCGSLPRELAGAELFGHARGAFTGADRDREGAFERASGGTLFLDEIGDLPLELQPLLLRALEAREVRRLGEGRYRKVDVRVIAATHRDLRREVEAGRFRQDLWHRLSVVRVVLPPLRERMEDLPLLGRAILDGLGERAAGVSLAPETVAALAAYRWPGNVRELRNAIEASLALGEPSIDPAALGTTDNRGEAAGEMPQEYREARRRALDAFERDFLSQLLARCGGNVSRAAEAAGLDRVYLHKLLKKHGIKAR